MTSLDLPPLTPAENLAADEVLLDAAEAGQGGECLLFWEPAETFVVVGYANKVATEVDLTACERLGVPVFRRCSGGGTVVQMPGGLNYSVILRITEHGPTRNISAANAFIMERNRAAIQSLVPGATVSVRGHTDLCVGELKVAGNAQRRRKHFLLFHGTLLLNCDLNRIGELLRMPSLQPDYRAGRSHGEFVTNLGLPAAAVKASLIQAWGAGVSQTKLPLAEIKKLTQERYLTRAWNFKF
jgi:lipoate---protein ligase